jgi:hypothetical protein
VSRLATVAIFLASAAVVATVALLALCMRRVDSAELRVL